MPFQSTVANIQVDKDPVIRITDMALNNIPVFNANKELIDSGINISAVGGSNKYYQFSNLNATASIQPFLKNANIGLPTQISGGLTAGVSTDPYLIYSNCTIQSIRMTIAGGCVQQATVGTTPTIRVDIYKMTSSSRTLVATYRIPFVAGTIGVFTTPSLSFQTGILNGLADVLTAGDVIGAEFVPESSDNNKMNGIINCSFILQTS